MNEPLTGQRAALRQRCNPSGRRVGWLLGWALALFPWTLAQDYPQWRGVNRDGQMGGLPVRTTWSEPARLLWSLPVGAGYATPLLVGGRIYVHARRAEEEEVLAIQESTAKILWSDRYPAPYQLDPAAAGHGKGPKSTPVFAEGRLYTLGISGILSCYDGARGTLLWRKRFDDRFPSASPVFGTAASPLVDAGTLYLHVGGTAKGALLALDAVTGKEKWAWTGDGPGYASPVLANLGGLRQLITQTERFLVGLSAQSGQLLWKLPFETAYRQNIVTPLVWRDLLLFSGINKGVTAIRLRRQNQTPNAPWMTEQVWHNREFSIYMSSPILTGDLLWGHSHRNKGQFFCLDAATGRALWSGEPRQGEHASLYQAHGQLFLLNELGDLLITTPDPRQPRLLRQYHLGESALWAHPVIYRNQILVRDQTHLRLYRLFTG